MSTPSIKPDFFVFTYKNNYNHNLKIKEMLTSEVKSINNNTLLNLVQKHKGPKSTLFDIVAIVYSQIKQTRNDDEFYILNNTIRNALEAPTIVNFMQIINLVVEQLDFFPLEDKSENEMDEELEHMMLKTIVNVEKANSTKKYKVPKEIFKILKNRKDNFINKDNQHHTLQCMARSINNYISEKVPNVRDNYNLHMSNTDPIFKFFNRTFIFKPTICGILAKSLGDVPPSVECNTLGLLFDKVI